MEPTSRYPTIEFSLWIPAIYLFPNSFSLNFWTLCIFVRVPRLMGGERKGRDEDEPRSIQQPTSTLRTIKFESRATFIPLWPFSPFALSLLLTRPLSFSLALDSSHTYLWLSVVMTFLVPMTFFVPQSWSSTTLYLRLISNARSPWVFCSPSNQLVDALFYFQQQNQRTRFRFYLTFFFSVVWFWTFFYVLVCLKNLE